MTDTSAQDLPLMTHYCDGVWYVAADDVRAFRDRVQSQVAALEADRQHMVMALADTEALVLSHEAHIERLQGELPTPEEAKDIIDECTRHIPFKEFDGGTWYAKLERLATGKAEPEEGTHE